MSGFWPRAVPGLDFAVCRDILQWIIGRCNNWSRGPPPDQRWATAGEEGHLASVEVFRLVLAMLSAAAGLIHFSAAPAHFSESSLHGSFFVVAGLLQIVAAGLLLRGGGTPLLRATAAGNIAIAGIWVMSRTIGTPVGPQRWTPEAIGFADATCSLIEVLVVAGCLLMLSADRNLVNSSPDAGWALVLRIRLQPRLTHYLG